MVLEIFTTPTIHITHIIGTATTMIPSTMIITIMGIHLTILHIIPLILMVVTIDTLHITHTETGILRAYIMGREGQHLLTGELKWAQERVWLEQLVAELLYYLPKQKVVPEPMTEPEPGRLIMQRFKTGQFLRVQDLLQISQHKTGPVRLQQIRIRVSGLHGSPVQPDRKAQQFTSRGQVHQQQQEHQPLQTGIPRDILHPG